MPDITFNIESVLSTDEIKEIVKDELRNKLRKDFSEMYHQTAFNVDSNYENNLIYRAFRDYIAENYAEQMKEKAASVFHKLEAAHLFGQSWDRKENPEQVNKLRSMQIINNALEELTPQIQSKILSIVDDTKDDTLMSVIGEKFTDKLFTMMYNLQVKNKISNL